MKRKSRGSMKIGDVSVGEGAPTFVIAEIGSNHDASLQTAKELISAAAEAGADAVKFQSLSLEGQYLKGAESDELKELFRRTELPGEWYEELARHAEASKVLFCSSPTYPEAVDMLEEVGVSFFKVASPQVATYPDLISYIASKGRPMVLSTGMVAYAGIARAVNLCREAGNDRYALLHCVSRYPTIPGDANLSLMNTYRRMFDCPVGFSDHTMGHSVTLAATAMGASIIEKHITLDRNADGPDHFFAMEPGEFGEMVKGIREVEASIGDGVQLSVDADIAELVDRYQVRLVAKRNIPAGTPLSGDLLIHRRAKEGIPLEDAVKLRNAVTREPIAELSPVCWHQIVFTDEGGPR